MASGDEKSDIFEFLNDLWDLLPENEKLRFGETWRAYEQTYGDVYTKLFEREFGINIDRCPLYANQRWLLHTFDATTEIKRAATYRSNQDVSAGINLVTRYLIRFSVDGGAQIEVDLRGADPTATLGTEIIAAINVAAGFAFTSLVVSGALIEFKSSTSGPTSTITFYPASVPASDASAIILGLDPVDLPTTFPLFPFSYQLGDRFMVSVPTLQTRIHDDDPAIMVRTEGLDYAVEFGSGVISFATLPPVTSVVAINGVLTVGSAVVTTAATTGIVAGMAVSGTGVPGGTFVQAVNGATTFTMSAAATAPGGSQPLTLSRTALWAKNSLVNKETPFNNYGFLMDIYDQNKPAYLKAVRGLWFAFWTGPRPENIRRSLYLLFGLPAASFPGTVTAIDLATITLTYADETTETFSIPSGLNAAVVLGQAVTRFQPLVDGIVVLDKVNSPGFLEREVGRFGIQDFLTEDATRGEGPDTDESRALKTVEENTYLPQIDVNAFISPDIKLSNVKTFLRNIQPKSRTFLFQVLVGTFRDELELFEHLGQDISMDVTPNMDNNPSITAEQSELDDAEINDGTGIILDSDGFTFADLAEVEVTHFTTTFPVVVDTFVVQG